MIALNVSSHASTSARRSVALSMAASVVTTASIVARFGSIMPEPLAIPPTANDAPESSVQRTACSFGKGSVVMIATAACALLPGDSWCAASMMPALTLR